MIITHASTIWDHDKKIKEGLDRMVQKAKDAATPIVYLQGPGWLGLKCIEMVNTYLTLMSKEEIKVFQN